jgi:plastocyanin
MIPPIPEGQKKMERPARSSTLAGACISLALAAASARAATIIVVATGSDMDAKFTPAVVTIRVGDTVQWVNQDGVHNVVSDTDLFNSGFVQPPEGPAWPFNVKFDDPGKFGYYCAIHGGPNGVGQSGIVIVRPARAASEVVFEKNAWDFQAASLETAIGDGPEELMRSFSGGGSFEMRAGVQIPAGSKITGLEVTGCDDSDTDDIKAGLLECPDPTADCKTIAVVQTTGKPGCTFFDTSIADGPTVDNLLNTYGLVIQLGADKNVRFRNMRVFYKRVVSAAPALATFGDVPTSHLFYKAIEAMSASGITSGCGSGNYCPEDPVTRGSMAGFLARALGLFFPN